MLAAIDGRGACTDAERRACAEIRDEVRGRGRPARMETYWVRLSFDGNEAGGEDSSVLIAFDEGVYGVSIGGDRAAFQISRVVFQDCWIPYSFGASLHSLLVGPLDIFHSKSNVRDSVSVGQDEPGYRMVWDKGGC